MINDAFLLRHPLLRCQQHIVHGGENVLRNPDTGDVIDHFNDRPAAQNFIPIYQRCCYEHKSEWVLQCREGSLPPSSSEEEDEGGHQQQQEQCDRRIENNNNGRSI